MLNNLVVELFELIILWSEKKQTVNNNKQWKSFLNKSSIAQEKKFKVKMANHSANHSYLKDRLGFDPDELMNEVEELFNNGPDDSDFESPSHKKFKSYQPSPSSSTSSVNRSLRDNYENTLCIVKGKERNRNQSDDESVNCC